MRDGNICSQSLSMPKISRNNMPGVGVAQVPIGYLMIDARYCVMMSWLINKAIDTLPTMKMNIPHRIHHLLE
jgi:hypothetical protein